MKDPFRVFRKGKRGESKLQRNKRRLNRREKWLYRAAGRRLKKSKQENTYLECGLCPKCESRVKKTRSTSGCCCGNDYYECVNPRCGFDKSVWWDDVYYDEHL